VALGGVSGRRPTPGHRSGTVRGTACRGFTLLEMIVVLVILGLALSITAGFIPRRNTGLELTVASENLAGTLRLARSRAIAENGPVIVAVAPDTHRVVVNGVARIVAPAIVLSMTGPGTIRFAPDGSASGGGIRLQGAGSARLVRVDWFTGRVSIADAR